MYIQDVNQCEQIKIINSINSMHVHIYLSLKELLPSQYNWERISVEPNEFACPAHEKCWSIKG